MKLLFKSKIFKRLNSKVIYQNKNYIRNIQKKIYLKHKKKLILISYLLLANFFKDRTAIHRI